MTSTEEDSLRVSYSSHATWGRLYPLDIGEPVTIYLLRHGETHWNRVRRLQGQKDSPLTWLGVQQVIAFGTRLAAEFASGPPPLLFASPLGRTIQSASLIADVMGVPFSQVRFDERLLERNQGAWDGLTAEEIAAGFNPDPHARRDWDFAPPGGESLRQVHDRVAAFVADQSGDQVTIAICHGVVSRVMRGAQLGLSPAQVVDLPAHTQDRFFKLKDGKVESILCESAVSGSGD